MSIKYIIMRFVRSYFKPMDPVLAQKWTRRMRLLYTFTALQCLIVTIYIQQKEKESAAGYLIKEPPHIRLIRQMELTDAIVVDGSTGQQNKFTLEEAQRSYNEQLQAIKDRYSV